MDLYNYNRSEACQPVWLGDTVLHESFWPVGDPDSEVSVELLYSASEIIAVQDSSLSILYEYGKDYILSGGKLILPRETSIEITPKDIYNPSAASANKHSSTGFTHTDGGYLFFAETDDILRRQYVVTYRHNETWKGPVPHPHKALPRLKKLLSEGSELTFAFWGDSITTGANASSLYNRPPYTEIWPLMVCNMLSDSFSSKINYINKAVGGTASAWGVEKFDEAFSAVKPDVFLIAFGMNDASGEVPADKYIENIEDIMKKAYALNPLCEVILLSTSLPNPKANQFYKKHEEYEPLLLSLAEKYGERAAALPFTSFHKYILSRKEFRDMTGNNINHPNDFFIRIHAQYILSEFTDEGK